MRIGDQTIAFEWGTCLQLPAPGSSTPGHRSAWGCDDDDGMGLGMSVGMSKQQKTPPVVDVNRLPPRPQEDRGWRAGRPVEDPEKTKRWGFVTAKPSEFLVHVRRGNVRASSSGQGASCFKWPGDSVAVIPTSLQQLRFRADQVTLERVGIEVVGLAVYRIADPLVAYRVLNFSFPERAQEKLEETLTAMFMGAVRRIVATLTVDDCLQKRKALLSEEMLREVAPVVGGNGRPEDSGRGWGVVLDTIEIQEVRVLSEAVFTQMQAPFRTALDRRAREARAEADKEITTREASCARAIEEVRITEALIVAERRRELHETEARIAQEIAERKLQAEAELRHRQNAIHVAEEQEKSARVLLFEELKKSEAEKRIGSHALLLEAAQKDAELDIARATALDRRRRLEIELLRLQGEAEAAVQMQKATAQAVVDESQSRVQLAKNLPALANAIGGKIGEVNVTSFGDGANPFQQLTGAVAAVVDLVKRA